MATEVIKIVDPDGGTGYDYLSLNTWEAGEQKDLVTADQIAVAKCRATGGTADTTAVTINGWTTDATRYIKIWTDPTESYRHNGKWNTGKYRLDMTTADTQPLMINVGHVKIDGLQMRSNNRSQIDWTQVPSGVSSTLWVSNSIMRPNPANEYGAGITIYSANANYAYIWNNIIYDNTGTSGKGILSNSLSVNLTMYAYNNTIQNCTLGLSREAGTFIAKNNIVKGSGNTNAYVGTFTTSDYNATDGTDTGDGGAHSRISQTFTFADEANDDFHLASNDAGARNYGTDLSGDTYLPFSDDIDGQTRSAPWDIGADEYVAAGGLSIPVAMDIYRQRRN
jgi:hypothetical protein